MHYLSKEVFDEIFFRAKKGDVKAKLDYLNAIEGLIVKNMKKYHPDFKNFDDLIQDGRVYALKLLDRYDINSASPPIAFVSSYIRYFYLDKNKKKTELTILDQSTNSGDDDSMSLKDCLADGNMTPEEITLTSDLLSKLADAVSSLPEPHYKLIYQYYFQNLTSEHIAKTMHLSKRQFYYEKQKALNELKEGVDREFLSYVSRLGGTRPNV